MRVSSPAEHEAFSKLTLHLVKCAEAIEEVAALRPDQPWTLVLDLFNSLREKVLRLAEAGLKN